MAEPRKAAASRRKKTPAPESKAKERGTSPWEWAVAALGGLILLGLVGYLVWEALARPTAGSPDIVIVKDDVIAQGDRFLVRIVVANHGNAAGANVRVLGTLFDGDRPLEQSAVTFDFVPQDSEGEGGLYFTNDPERFRLVLRAEGYAKP